FTDDLVGHPKYLYRDYQPHVGRWATRDPISEQGGRNLYGFVDNSPTARIDVHGAAGIGSFFSGLQNYCCPHKCPREGQSCLIGVETKFLPAGLSPEKDEYIKSAIGDLDDVAGVGQLVDGGVASGVPGVLAGLLANTLDQSGSLLHAYYNQFSDAL